MDTWSNIHIADDEGAFIILTKHIWIEVSFIYAFKFILLIMHLNVHVDMFPDLDLG